MMNESEQVDPEEHKARLRSVYRSIPALDPPRDWKQITLDASDEAAMRCALEGLPTDSELYKLFSERLAEFLGVSVSELGLEDGE